MPTRPLDRSVIERAYELQRSEPSRSIRSIARELGIHNTTLLRYMRSRDHGPATQGIELPESTACRRPPLHVDTCGSWGIIGDVHVPYHDPATIVAFIKECREIDASGVLINGDFIDLPSISRFGKRKKTSLADDIETARKILQQIRKAMPSVRIIYREGNHEDRLPHYLMEHCEPLAELAALGLPDLLGLADLGIEWVSEKQFIYLGKLLTLHGHELRRGGGVNPARYVYLQTGESCLVGHWHQQSMHHSRSAGGREVGCWSTGCACDLSPYYARINQWGHGYAIVDVRRGGQFACRLVRVVEGGRTV